MSLAIKVLPAVVSWGIFIFVVLQVPYPENLTQANLTQLVSFFIPLFLALSLTINLFLKNYLSSCSISLGLISVLILKTLDSLNIVTSILIIITTALLISYFRKTKRGLTNYSKIPKLTRLKKG